MTTLSSKGIEALSKSFSDLNFISSRRWNPLEILSKLSKYKRNTVFRTFILTFQIKMVLDLDESTKLYLPRFSAG